MTKMSTVAGVAVFALCIASGWSWSLKPSADEISNKRKHLEQSLSAQARSLAKEAQAHIAAGEFYQASFILPKFVSDTDALARYMPPARIEALQPVAGIALWPRPQDGNVVGRTTHRYDLYSFLQGFYRTVEAPLTERERRLIKFGQMTAPAAREVYDIEALAAWFKNELGVDARQSGLLYSEKVELPRAAYDVDHERWVLPDLTPVVPERIGDSLMKFGQFGLPGTQLALVPVNLPHADESSSAVVIPMAIEDARCAEMTAYYRFFPVVHDGPGTSATLSYAIKVHVSEVQLYCAAGNKLLWSRTL